MADPKIRYDIEASIEGEANVEQLGTTLPGLGDNLEDDFKKQALKAADALYSSGAKQNAVAAFQQVNNETQELAVGHERAAGMMHPLDDHAKRCMTARRETLHK